MGQIKTNYINHMGSDLTVVNAARVSFGSSSDKLTDRDKKLIKFLAKEKHMSPFEHCQLTVKIKCPIYISKQIMRHRTFCLSGNTSITFNRPDKWKKGFHVKQKGNKNKEITLKRLYKLWNDNSQRSKIEKMLIRCYDEHNKEFTVSNVKDILYSGKKPIYEIETEKGKKLKCSKDHEILTTEGWQRLENAVGLEVTRNNIATMSKDCYIMTNGKLAWRDYDWMKEKKDKGFSVNEIAEEAGCSYHCIRKWLKIHNLQFDHKKVLKNYIKTNGPWNKGKKGYKINRIMTEEEKEKIRKARSGANSNFWKGGITRERANIGRWTTQIAPKVHEKFNYTCQKCFKKGGKLEAHHIVPVTEDISKAYDFDNLQTLCKDCHKKIHGKNYKEWSKKSRGNKLLAREEKIINVRYIGTEDTYDISVRGPNHNFIANDMIVHNSFNEISRRYTSKNLEFYVSDKFRKQSKDNKQASEGELIQQDNNEARSITHKVQEGALEAYEELLHLGVCREQARGVLPQNLMTEFYMTGNLRNWIHFVKLRIAHDAQGEVREIADQVLQILRENYPISTKALMNEL